MKANIQNLLKGMRPLKDDNGRILVQSINNMQIVCLTTDKEYDIDKFGNPLSLLVDTKRGYGHITAYNSSDKPIIMLPQSTFITSYSSQDHATLKSSYVPASGSRQIDDSCCVESSQPGFIERSDRGLTRTVLPYFLREKALEKVGQDAYNKLWDDISTFNISVNASRQAHISDYYKKHGKKLEQFIAHFERPKNCIGAIVFVDGEIIAIDKFPSFNYTSQVWDTLIRDCYGAVAITEEIKKSDNIKRFTSITDQNRKFDYESVADYLKRTLDLTKKSIEDEVRDRIEEIFDIEFNVSLDSSKDGYKSEILESDGYIGQVVSESGFNHLVSIVKKSSFNPERLRIASELKQKAKRQNDFTL